MVSLLRDNQVTQLREIFDFVDTNNGRIDGAQLGTVLRAFGVVMSDWEISDLIAEIDVGDANGTLDFQEFLFLTTRTLLPPNQQPSKDKQGGGQFGNLTAADLEGAFKELDVDGDGQVSAVDLKKAFDSIGEDYDPEMIREMITEVSSQVVEHGNCIKYADFQATMAPIIK